MDHNVVLACQNVAVTLDVEWEALAAVVEVESNGRIYATVNGEREPLILPEYHIFDRQLSGNKRSKARSMKLSHPTWGKLSYPRSQKARWALLDRWKKIDSSAAYMSCSWGVGQVMGFHWKSLGYKSVSAMIARARSGAQGQLELMARYIKVNHLADELRRLDWSGFARGYNGPGYRKNKYHTKMAAAYRRYKSGLESVATSSYQGMLRMGASGARVRELQRLLVRTGQPLLVDSDFGPATKLALLDFQTSVGINADGIAGPQTMRELGKYRQSAKEKLDAVKVTQDADVGKGLGVGVGGAVAIETATAQVNAVMNEFGTVLPDSVLAGLSLVAAGLAIAGIGYAIWSWYSKKSTFEGDE